MHSNRGNDHSLLFRGLVVGSYGMASIGCLAGHLITRAFQVPIQTKDLICVCRRNQYLYMLVGQALSATAKSSPPISICTTNPYLWWIVVWGGIRLAW